MESFVTPGASRRQNASSLARQTAPIIQAASSTIGDRRPFGAPLSSFHASQDSSAVHPHTRGWFRLFLGQLQESGKLFAFDQA